MVFHPVFALTIVVTVRLVCVCYFVVWVLLSRSWRMFTIPAIKSTTSRVRQVVLYSDQVRVKFHVIIYGHVNRWKAFFTMLSPWQVVSFRLVLLAIVCWYTGQRVSTTNRDTSSTRKSDTTTLLFVPSSVSLSGVLPRSDRPAANVDRCVCLHDTPVHASYRY